MSVFYNTDNLPKFKNAVITIGTFDGVHLGHQKILKTVIDKAKEVNGESVVITFHPHPRKLLFPQQPLKILTPLSAKIWLLSSLGIDHIVVVPFTKEFAALSASQYIKEFLIEKLNPHTIVIGYDHHFGQDRSGNIQLLKQEQNDFGYKLMEIPEQVIDEISISSTKIRSALMSGKVAESAKMTGRNYSIKGKVVKGRQLGRAIGYPTANIQPLDSEQIIPAIGIYCVQVKSKHKLYGGMLSIGYNPTVTDEKTIKIEVNIFDFDQSIYNEEVEVFFIEKMRDEEKFDSLDALKEQLKMDEMMARGML